MNILAISGSLRADSLNTAALKTLMDMAGDDLKITLADLSAIPLFNGDIEEEPDSVLAFKQAIEAADALIIATPEYNYSIPGMLKNAIDWASRPAFNSVLKDKKVALISASMAFTGGVRAQQHLKVILSGTLSEVIPMPEVLLASAHTLVTDGRVSDERTKGFLAKLLDAVRNS